MSQKNHPPGPTPPGNRPKTGVTPDVPDQDEPEIVEKPTDETGADQQQDEKRRIGQFTGKGEPPRQQ